MNALTRAVLMATRRLTEGLVPTSASTLLEDLSAGQDLAHVAEVALLALVRHVGAMGGVIWVARDEEGPLELAASFGVDADILQKRGDPLADEVFESQEAVAIDQLPPNVSHVLRTSLVDAVPKCLLAIPLTSGQTKVGVAELAGALRKRQPSDLQPLLAPIAFALRHAVVSERVQVLRDRLARVRGELLDPDEHRTPSTTIRTRQT